MRPLPPGERDAGAGERQPTPAPGARQLRLELARQVEHGGGPVEIAALGEQVGGGGTERELGGVPGALRHREDRLGIRQAPNEIATSPARPDPIVHGLGRLEPAAAAAGPLQVAGDELLGLAVRVETGEHERRAGAGERGKRGRGPRLRHPLRGPPRRLRRDLELPAQVGVQAEQMPPDDLRRSGLVVGPEAGCCEPAPQRSDQLGPRSACDPVAEQQLGLHGSAAARWDRVKRGSDGLEGAAGIAREIAAVRERPLDRPLELRRAVGLARGLQVLEGVGVARRELRQSQLEQQRRVLLAGVLCHRAPEERDGLLGPAAAARRARSRPQLSGPPRPPRVARTRAGGRPPVPGPLRARAGSPPRASARAREPREESGRIGRSGRWSG